MKNFLCTIAITFFSCVALAQTTELLCFLKSQPEVYSVEEIKGNDFFNKTLKITFRQPLVHSDTTLGFFLQRIFVADKGRQNPVVFITEGYGAGYASNSDYVNELSTLLTANQICVEHRYFGESWPDSLNWDYLTVENAAADHHKIVETLKKYYVGKWINTGISKGGQTALYHRTFYPNDVEVTVGYVCPLNFGVEDGRHEPFIQHVPGTAEVRRKIVEFQIEILKNREQVLPMLEKYIKTRNMEFRISTNELLDFIVLEYPFAFWQFGISANEVPSDFEDTEILFNHLVKVSNPNYFSLQGIEEIKSFFVQAARELGYYGYDLKPYKKYLSIKSARNYMKKIFLPEGLEIAYHKKTAQKVEQFIQTTDKKILFIYGEFDPWSASGFNVPEKENILKIVKPAGSHSTRITNLPGNQQVEVIQKLEKWLGIDIYVN